MWDGSKHIVYGARKSTIWWSVDNGVVFKNSYLYTQIAK